MKGGGLKGEEGLTVDYVCQPNNNSHCSGH